MDRLQESAPSIQKAELDSGHFEGIDFNKTCLTILTAFGIRHYAEYYSENSFRSGEHVLQNEYGGVSSFELGDLMRIFGSSLFDGSIYPPFVNNEIAFNSIPTHKFNIFNITNEVLVEPADPD